MPTPPPDAARRSTRHRRGVGLIELLTVVAVLIVALALIVATARHVRASSANELTRKRLQALVDETSRLIVRDHLDPTLPLPPTLGGDPGVAGATSGAPSANLNEQEAALQAFARDSSDRLAAVRAAALAREQQGDAPTAADVGTRAGAGKPDVAPAGPAAAAAALLAAGGGTAELRDAWGRPIALMGRQVPSVGIAPDDGPFFVSAGPDGAFLTLSDNLYSYDIPALVPSPGVSAAGVGRGSGAVRMRDRRDEDAAATRPTAGDASSTDPAAARDRSNREPSTAGPAATRPAAGGPASVDMPNTAPRPAGGVVAP